VKPSVDRWIDWKSFQRAHTNLFPTPQSLDWFIRANQIELRKRGLLTKFANIRRVDGPALEDFIEKLVQAEIAAAA
jgi:hypothetical protein